MYSTAAIACDHQTASLAGLEILKAGGNAVDAAVAASFTLSVVRPYSCGIGGGGFLLLHLPADPRRPRSPHQTSIAIDYRETAPARITKDSFENDPDPHASTHGGKAVCTPGTVAGLLHALDHYGTLPRERVLAPAIRAAEQGFSADRHYVDVAAKETLDYLQADNSRIERFRFLWDRFLHRGNIRVGDRVHAPEQAAALRAIAQRGVDGFYAGPVADAILNAIHSDNAFLSRDDLHAYSVIERQPLETRLGTSRVLTMPPPSSGGIVLAQVFAVLDRLRNTRLNPVAPTDPDYVHAVVEACKHAFADRARWVGDPAFVDIPLNKLLDPATLRDRADAIDMARTRPADTYGLHDQLPPDHGTSHLSVVDPQGGAASCTETVNLYFGSLLAVPEFGFFLNNEMDDFQARMGKANAFDLLHAERNRPEPRKRPLSSMTPTIVLNASDKPLVLAGASGGPRIISATLQTILNVLWFDLTAEQAVAAPRFHHQWKPDEIQLEPALRNSPLAHALAARNHTTAPRDAIGAVQLIRASPTGWQPASDPRKGGSPAGY